MLFVSLVIPAVSVCFAKRPFFPPPAPLDVSSAYLATFLSLSFNCLAQYLFLSVQTPALTRDTPFPRHGVSCAVSSSAPKGIVLLLAMFNLHCVRPV